jgi:surfeit locus 1 family protein
MYFRFSWTTTAVCFVLASAFCSLSYWQWCRHLEKKVLVDRLQRNLHEPVTPAAELSSLGGEDWVSLVHRRVAAEGSFDFEHEIVLRNRRLRGEPGVHVLTPFRTVIGGRESMVLVSRGFVPLRLSGREARARFRNQSTGSFVALIKEPRTARTFFAPQDPEPKPGAPWVDAWLRVDLDKIEKQLPYDLAPFYLEIMGDPDPSKAENEIVVSESGREELLVMGFREAPVEESPDGTTFPVPTFNTIVPADRHLGYVWEWAFMAIMTILIGVVFQLKRPSTAVS